MDFNTNHQMRGTFSGKWDSMGQFGVGSDGIAMHVADSDYPTAPCVIEAVTREAERGIFNYGFDRKGYVKAFCWWMQTRHDWTVDPDWVLTAQGLGMAIALCLDVWSEPGDDIAFFTPVYHEFRLKTHRARRNHVELPMALVDGRYELDWDGAEAAITPKTKVLLFCSPQNPSGRVWSVEELRQVAAFAARHDLILVSDEVHADLVYAGNTHVPMAIAAPEHRDRMVTLFAASKTFNLAGLRVGQMIIPDDRLRTQMGDRLTALNYDATTLGAVASKAAYSPDGNEWVAAQLAYLEENRRIFDEGVNAIPGLRSMPLQATYLPWVDFSGTGMSEEEITARVNGQAQITPAPGKWFGTGSELWNRFVLATPRANIEETVRRLQAAFSDLQ
ncbi:MalY/PatB family protein [Nioella aestuarii]|uniref:MalY/PatB family protein n=1 Tax=Nioella aestuarii TaxID=1662864 RepID=UPI003D7F920F